MARAISGQTHLCAAPNCGREIPIELMFCGPDWHRLPEEIRRRVNWAYTRYARHPEESDRLQELAAARRAALAALAAAPA